MVSVEMIMMLKERVEIPRAIVGGSVLEPEAPGPAPLSWTPSSTGIRIVTQLC
jgi:hypothetical protein